MCNCCEANTQAGPEPQIIEFGPYRAIGMSENGKGDFAALWERFMPRVGEITMPAASAFSFGICRCLPGATDGKFEYVAAIPAAADTQIPEGMIEVPITACTYVVFPVASLAELPGKWEQSFKWFAEHPEWQGYCHPDNCDCANHPSFELYPADFSSNGKLFIYLPIQPVSER